MKKTTSYVPESRPYTFTAEQMEPFTPQPRENLGRSEDEDDSDYRMVSAIVSAIRSTRPKAKQISNEDLRNICLQAIREGQTQNPSWIDGQIHRLWEQAQKATAASVVSALPKPLEIPVEVPARSISTESLPQTKAAEIAATPSESPLKKRKALKSPDGDEPGSRKEANAMEMPVLARHSHTFPEDPSHSESTHSFSGQGGQEMSPVQEPGADSPASLGSTTSGEVKSHEDPLQGIVPTEISPILDQEHLLKIHELHQVWKSAVLNPRAQSAQGRANFRGLDLRHLDFSHLDFSYADFSESKIEGVKFIAAKLVRCHFVKAHADGGDFSQANLRRANFSRAHLGTAVFLDADLRDTEFAWAQGTYVDALKNKENPVIGTDELPANEESSPPSVADEDASGQSLFH